MNRVEAPVGVAGRPATSADPPLPSVPGTRERVATLATNGLGFAGFYLLLPAVPVLAERHGGTVVAGAATATFMATTVATQLLTAELLRRWRMSTLLVVAGVAMGPPTLLYDATSGVAGFF